MNQRLEMPLPKWETLLGKQMTLAPRPHLGFETNPYAYVTSVLVNGTGTPSPVPAYATLLWTVSEKSQFSLRAEGVVPEDERRVVSGLPLEAANRITGYVTTLREKYRKAMADTLPYYAYVDALRAGPARVVIADLFEGADVPGVAAYDAVDGTGIVVVPVKELVVSLARRNVHEN